MDGGTVSVAQSQQFPILVIVNPWLQLIQLQGYIIN